MKNDVWIRLHSGWAPQGGNRAIAWALWQPGYVAEPWPREELRPSFTYYVCEDLPRSRRGIVARATATGVVRLAQVPSADSAYRLVADALFDDDLAIPPEEWHSERYNQEKAKRPWPQMLTAWRVVTEPVGPHVLPELAAFPRTGWLRTPRIAL